MVTVGATSIEVLPMTSPRRTRYVLRNMSAGGQVITISHGKNKAAVTNEGVPLYPGEPEYDSDSGGGYLCFDGAIQAISTAAGGILSIYEV